MSRAYNSSSLMYKVLRAAGWGPLTNLGFYSLLQPFQWLSVPAVQVRPGACSNRQSCACKEQL